MTFRGFHFLHRCLLFFTFAAVALPGTAQRWMENLDRGVVAVRPDADTVFVSWRLLGTDPYGTGFNLYRSTDGGAAKRLNAEVLAAGTNFVDTTANLSDENAYFVRAVVAGSELESSESFTLPADAPVRQYLSVPLQRPPGGTVGGSAFSYAANDASVGDLDGDGDFEIVLKWDPSNSKDNSQSGYTGNTILDAYDLDATHRWRIDLGVNIRSGAHYTQFLVYDFDGDGRAEIACRTAEGSRDSTGHFIASDPGKFFGTMPPVDHGADRRNADGYILGGPEFLTIFEGATGEELASTNYVPQRHPDTFFPSGAQLDQLWGDGYGNRIDRFLAGVAYLDGQRPSLVMCRGYYTRSVLAAFDWRDGQLTERWVFDTADGHPEYRGQGNHGLSVADVDADGRDEVVYGAAVIDDDGTGLFTTDLGHGDALHVSDLDPMTRGQEVWGIHENESNADRPGTALYDARTGAIRWTGDQGRDVGRGVAADVDPRYLGAEMWGGAGGLRTVDGTRISNPPSSTNFVVWWDDDLLRELLDGNHIDKWNWGSATTDRLLTATGCTSNNGTKSTPCLSADLFGDWREEVIWRTTDNTELRIFTTTIFTDNRLPTLMHDPQYRVAIAWQNVAYNQPPHPGYFLGEGMAPAPTPDIELVGATAAENTGRLTNLSVRTTGGTDAATLILGFTIQGPGEMGLLARGVGPRLAELDVPGVMTDPRIELFNQADTSAPIDGNDDWSSAANADAVASVSADLYAFALPNPSKDAALLASLPAGVYTAQIQPVSGGPGIALAELYAVDVAGDLQLGNASARAEVGGGAQTLITGFVIAGSGTMDLLIRAVGPGLERLSVPGPLSDVALAIYKKRNPPEEAWDLVAANRDWIASSGVSAQMFNRVYAFGLSSGSGDAAVRVRLPPGIYTAHATAVGENGIGLVEMFVME